MSKKTSSDGVTAKIYLKERKSSSVPTGMIKFNKNWKSGHVDEVIGELIAMRLSTHLLGDKVKTANCKLCPVLVQQAGKSTYTLALKSEFDDDLVMLSDLSAGNRLSRNEAVVGHVLGEHLVAGQDYSNGMLLALTYLLQDNDFVGFMGQNAAIKVTRDRQAKPMVFDAVFQLTTMNYMTIALSKGGASRISMDLRRVSNQFRHLQVRNLTMLNDSSMKYHLFGVFSAIDKKKELTYTLKLLKQDLIAQLPRKDSGFPRIKYTQLIQSQIDRS